VMNGIVRVTDKSVSQIDALRSNLAKEARRISDSLQRWSIRTRADPERFNRR
jgi:hypothetical protein